MVTGMRIARYSKKKTIRHRKLDIVIQLFAPVVPFRTSFMTPKWVIFSVIVNILF